ncbi:hypothetical protein NUU61_002666 [Penicillium alfredii]|uniref:Uncharacterized protein n=1 Tax=Penicillium alfredii TaxID=1506179 RepID=A0A9W9FS65_9EURO|nr:uncharacterized protein NUU61_002666 [Penicillium alfredii]KAJ5105319.1 hypothetical protein NUU61_002666 [Penicillium alfredii]
MNWPPIERQPRKICRGHFEFYALDRLPETYYFAQDKIESHTLHFLREGSTELDGRRVLIVVHPAIAHRWINEPDTVGHEISCKGYAVLENPESLQDQESMEKEL